MAVSYRLKSVFIVLGLLTLSPVALAQTIEPDPAPPTAETTKAEACTPGCDCTSGEDGKGVLGMIERHAETVRVRDKAYAQQIFKKPDNTMGMTCFDRALGVTSRLGTIFSDLVGNAVYNGTSVVMNGKLPAENKSVFGQSSYPNLGTNSTLSTSINKVINDTMNKHVLNFNPGNFSSGSLSAKLGTTSLGYLNSFSGDMQGMLDNITSGPMSSINDSVNSLNSVMSQLKGALNMLGSAVPSTVGAIVATINSVWNQIESSINNAVSTAMNQMISQFLTPMFNKVMGSANSLAQNKCDYMSKLWKGTGINGTIAGFKPLVGSGQEKGLPYFKIKDLVNGTMPGLNANDAPDFVQAILNEDGAAGVINRALKDLQGPLKAPGNMPSWTTPPILSPGMSTDDIIAVMNGGGIGDVRTTGLLPARSGSDDDIVDVLYDGGG